MYAVVELQGTQVRVTKDDKISVNRIKDVKGKTIKVKDVLFGQKGSSHFVGTPHVKDAYVEFEVVGNKRGRKVVAFKYRDRKSSQSKIGHRQDLTELRVKNIHFSEAAKEKKTETKKK